MSDKPPYFYETQIQWTAGREGEIRSPGLPTIKVAPPPEFQGVEGVWTPEHLYLASVNSCFMTTFLAVAGLSKLSITSFDCDSVARLEKLEGSGYQITEIKLRPKLIISQGKDAERAARILEKAERNCLISNSIKTAVSIEPDIQVSEIGVEELGEELVEV